MLSSHKIWIETFFSSESNTFLWNQKHFKAVNMCIDTMSFEIFIPAYTRTHARQTGCVPQIHLELDNAHDYA